MSIPGDHIDDDTLSAIVDEQLTPEEQRAAQAHVNACVSCQARLEEFRSVVTLVRSLPEVEPPRDFALGPRLLEDPPNLVRLQRWYTATRIAAGSLAAVFVLLAAGTLYIDSRPAPAPEIATANAPAVAPRAAAGAAVSAPATVTVRSAAPAAAPAAGRAPQADDQVAAATSVNPLPTPVPTVAPPGAPVPAAAAVPVAADPGAPWRITAIIAGLLAALMLLAALAVRHRLSRALPQH